MKRSSVSFTSNLCELADEDLSFDRDSSGKSSQHFRKSKSYSDVLVHSSRHIRRKTSPDSYFDLSSKELDLSANIGLDLALLEQLQSSIDIQLVPPLPQQKTVNQQKAIPQQKSLCTHFSLLSLKK